MSAEPKVFVTRRIPQAGLDVLAGKCQVDLWTGDLPPERETLLARAAGMDGLLCLLTERIDAEVMDAAGPGLKVISTLAVGVDHIDLAAATARRIPVGNTPGVLTGATADFTFALLLAAARRVVAGDAYVRAGKWQTWGAQVLLGPEVHGATLGIIGFGRIGQAVAQRAQGFGMRVIYYDPGAAAHPAHPLGVAVDLATLLAEADFITLHTPLTAQTRGLINAAAFEQMKSSAVLINTARGAVVETQALYAALKERRIFAAALDVTDPEPLPANHPLLELDNLIIAPHIASAGVGTRNRMAEIAARNLLAGLSGERLPHCVNPQVYAGLD